MNERLLGEEALRIVKLIDGYSELALKLREYPMGAVRSIFRKDGYIGPRTLMWLLRGIQVIEFDPFSRKSFSVSDLTLTCQTAMRCLRFDIQSKKELIWRTSAMVALSVLKGLTVRLPLSDAEKLCADVSVELEKYRVVLDDDMRKLIDKGLRGEDLFLAGELLSALCPYGWQPRSHSPVLKAAIEDLEHQLALHSAGSAHYRPVSLARAAMLVDMLASRDPEPSWGWLESQVSRAAVALVSEPRGSTTNQLLSNIPGFGYLFSMPWEETLLLSDIRATLLPTNVVQLEKVLDDLRSRVVPASVGCAGLLDLGTEFCPRPAPHFTGYGIVLGMKIARVLRQRLRLLLKDRVEAVEPGCVASVAESLALDSPRLLETEEGTISYLIRKLKREDRGIESLRGRNTILLFGPPGTGKTTLMPALGRFLEDEYKDGVTSDGWTLFNLNPRLFLRHDSYAELLAEVSDLFEVMLRVDHCVFFLDEAEELVRMRGSESDRFSRMFTAAMLVFLTRLERTPSVFVLATNYIDKMDEAAIRKGRFAIRKGLGFLHRDSVKSLVEDGGSDLSESLRDSCAACFSRRTVKDVLDGLAAVRAEWASTHNADAAIAVLKARKPYVIDAEIKRHDLNVMKYDDSFSPK